MKCVPPWVRWRRAIGNAAAEAVTARQELRAAEYRRQVAASQAANARAVTERLRDEIVKNGWTELLQHSWGAR